MKKILLLFLKTTSVLLISAIMLIAGCSFFVAFNHIHRPEALVPLISSLLTVTFLILVILKIFFGASNPQKNMFISNKKSF